MILTLLRHSEVETAYQHCYNGHNDIGLSPQGRHNAQALAQALEEQSFDAIYCSDLRRCKESLHPFGFRNEQVVYTPLLREKSWGRHEGKSFDQICQEDQVTYEDFEQWLQHLDGEPYTSYINRIERFFLYLLPLKSHQNVLIMTHAGVIRVLISLVKKITIEEAFSKPLAYGCYLQLDTHTWSFGPLHCLEA